MFALLVTLLCAQAEPGQALLQARAFRQSQNLAQAKTSLDIARSDPFLKNLVAAEDLALALAADNMSQAIAKAEELLATEPYLISPHLMLLAERWSGAEPKTFLHRYSALEGLRKRDDPQARSLLLKYKILAAQTVGDLTTALAAEKQQYLEEPIADATPKAAPRALSLTAEERLQRAETILAANRNDVAIGAFVALNDGDLNTDQRCRKALGLGLGQRKQRAYKDADAALQSAQQWCAADADRLRRASYLRAKVVSIKDGLAAIPLIDQFAEKFAGNTMVDDVWFWAGDLYQRRGRRAEAEAYFSKIAIAAMQDDYCGEARFRLAWMAYRAGELPRADSLLEDMETTTVCKLLRSDLARSAYWRARIAARGGNESAAASFYKKAIDSDPLGFYAQIAASRVGSGPASPSSQKNPELCQGAFAPVMSKASGYLQRGLPQDAADLVLQALGEARTVMGQSQAVALGTERASGATASAKQVDGCSEWESRLALVMFLDKAGAYKDSHYRIRTEFSSLLAAAPTGETLSYWRAAYPLAFADALSVGAKESDIPPMFLQALAREESAYDPNAVSWAGAYGLTQLLLSTALDAAHSKKGLPMIKRGEDLFVPEVSARLGAATLRQMGKRFKGNLALTLASYNAGQDVALTWWKRHAADGLDILAEEITIQETRGYVKRVLQTFGIYRWLYEQQPLGLAIPLDLPAL